MRLLDTAVVLPSAFVVILCLCSGCVRSEEFGGEILVMALSADTVSVGGEAYSLARLEQALEASGIPSPYHVVVAIEDQEASFGDVELLYSALLELHEEGIVASVSLQAFSDGITFPPRGRFRSEVPKSAVCVGISASGAISVGQVFQPGVPVSSLGDLRSFVSRALQADPEKPFVLEADAGSSAEFVEKVQIALKQEGVQVLYLLGSRTSGEATENVCRVGPVPGEDSQPLPGSPNNSLRQSPVVLGRSAILLEMKRFLSTSRRPPASQLS